MRYCHVTTMICMRVWREYSKTLVTMAYNIENVTVFSRKLLLLLLLVIPRRDPLCFSAQSGGRDLPDATGILSVLRLFPYQEMTDALQESVSRCYLLSICLLGYIANVHLWTIN